jgi:hypothetical protein
MGPTFLASGASGILDILPDTCTPTTHRHRGKAGITQLAFALASRVLTLTQPAHPAVEIYLSKE